jgi:hypothetical protein
VKAVVLEAGKVAVTAAAMVAEMAAVMGFDEAACAITLLQR